MHVCGGEFGQATDLTHHPKYVATPPLAAYLTGGIRLCRTWLLQRRPQRLRRSCGSCRCTQCRDPRCVRPLIPPCRSTTASLDHTIIKQPCVWYRIGLGFDAHTGHCSAKFIARWWDEYARRDLILTATAFVNRGTPVGQWRGHGGRGRSRRRVEDRRCTHQASKFR